MRVYKLFNKEKGRLTARSLLAERTIGEAGQKVLKGKKGEILTEAGRQTHTGNVLEQNQL